MDPQIKYLLVSSAFLTLTYFVYIVVFRKERNFKQRRFYLLFAVIFSLLIPLANIYIKLPATLQTKKQKIEVPVQSNFMEPQPQPDMQNYFPPMVPEIASDPINPKQNINWWLMITYLYIAVSAVLLLRILMQLLSLQVKVWRSTVIPKKGYKLVINNHYKSSFSFFHWIFIHSETKHDANLEKIISHECVHVCENHSVDTLLFEVVCALIWFNPFIWLMRNSIQLVHEYLADEGALKTGIDQFQYQALMINQVAEADIVGLTSHFNSSTLKKRITMIVNGDKYTKTKYRILTLLPVAVSLLIIIATVNGCNQQKVMVRDLSRDPAISSTFSPKEIKDLAEIRVLVDNMVQNQTGETDSKKAYEKFIPNLAESKTAGNDISNQIVLPHDSLVQEIKANSTFQEIWRIGGNSQYTYISINLSGKFMDFLHQLSKENSHYLSVIEGIEITGDISPASIGDFIKNPGNYHWESEAEKLYASVMLLILTNKTLLKVDLYQIEAEQFILKIS